MKFKILKFRSLNISRMRRTSETLKKKKIRIRNIFPKFKSALYRLIKQNDKSISNIFSILV